MSACRSCGAPVLWAVTDGGRRMPVDRDPAPAGNLVIADRHPDGTPHMTVVDPEQLLLGDPPRYLSHFVTCPHANEHRKLR
jgi:hypothetical protein